MNFWTFKDDNMQGYYHPISNKAAMQQGAQLANLLFSLIAAVAQLALSILEGAYLLILWLVRSLYKS